MDRAATSFKKPLLLSLLLLLSIALGFLPLYASKYTVILVTSIIMHILLTVSWVLFSGPTGYISLAPAAFFGVGIYSSALFGKTISLPLVIAVGGIASFSLALLVGVLTLRLRGIYFSMFTFGLVVLIQQVLLWFEVNKMHTRGRFVVLVDNTTIYYVMLAILAALLLTSYAIRRSKYGLALQSIGEEEEAATHTGINVTTLKTITFAVSAFFMGAAGSIMATRWTYIDPYIAFNPLLSFMPVLMAILGGMQLFCGPILGAAIFGYLEELLITKFPYYYMLIFGTIMVLVILYLPGGLTGLIRGWRKGDVGEQHANP
ncbi:MAG: branched-chain amino acid ABC transporter permease [Thermodesulfobacteriota bacterium]